MSLAAIRQAIDYQLSSRLADNGFESNEDYSFAMRCLLDNTADRVPCLNITGDSSRRNTSLANALSLSLPFAHQLYFDFSDEENHPDSEQIAAQHRQNTDRAVTPVTPFERIVSEACAFSEAEATVLILDQLQAAPFKLLINIYHFITHGLWQSAGTEFTANRNRLLLMLISEQNLYHSLQKASFRIWTSARSGKGQHYKPQEFGLDASNQALFNALNALFDNLGKFPTQSEMKTIVNDILLRVRSREQLCQCLFGWMEGLEYDALQARPLKAALDQVIAQTHRLLDEETIEAIPAPVLNMQA